MLTPPQTMTDQTSSTRQGWPTNRRVLALALPATIANVTTPLLGLVGTVAIGRSGDAALLGAIALGSVVFDALFWSFGSLRMATAGLTARAVGAQAVGAQDSTETDLILARALLAGALIGSLMVVAQVPIAAVVAVTAGASPEVSASLFAYFHVRIFAAPFTLANYALLGSVTGRGRTDVGLALQVAINLSNIGLTILLVLGLDWGIIGAAWSALIAEAAGTLCGLAAAHRLGSRLRAVERGALLDLTALVSTLRVNADILIRTLALVFAITLFSTVSARSGDVTLAANAVLWNLFLVGGFFLDGFATSAEALCGQAVGARDAAGFTRAARLSMLWCVGFGIAVSTAFIGGGGPFIDGVTTSEAVRAAARADLVPAALAPLIAALPFAFDGIYIGAGWSRAMRNLMLGAVAAFVLVLLTMRTAWPGNLGLWLSFLFFLGARGIGQAFAYPRLVRETFGSGRAATARAGTAASA